MIDENFLKGLSKAIKELDNQNEQMFTQLEKELTILQRQYRQVVEQNKNLQSERKELLFALNCINDQIKTIKEPLLLSIDGINQARVALITIKDILKEALK